MTHTANELRTKADILDSDGVTVLASAVPAGVTNLTGNSLKQAQLEAAETTHMLIFRGPDASVLKSSGYVRADGVLFIVDYPAPCQLPRLGMWLEVYCHVERSGNAN